MHDPSGRRLPDSATVLDSYAQVPREWIAAEKVLQGEDRFLCTLLIVLGWRLEMSVAAVVSTRTPNTWAALASQQCRWQSSTMVNQAALLAHPTQWLRLPFRAYIAAQLLGSVLSPLCVVLLLLQATLVTAPAWLAYPLVLLPPLGFALVCCLAWADPDYALASLCREWQLSVLTGCCRLYTALAACVLLLLALQLLGAAVANVWSLSAVLFAAIAAVYVAVCLMHGDRVVLKLPVLLATIAPLQVRIPLCACVHASVHTADIKHHLRYSFRSTRSPTSTVAAGARARRPATLPGHRSGASFTTASSAAPT